MPTLPKATDVSGFIGYDFLAALEKPEYNFFLIEVAEI
jgi:hypothetical protein